MGAKMIRISGSLIWSKTLMEMIFNPCGNFGEVRWVQLAKATLLTSSLVPLGYFLDVLRSVQMLKRESGVWKEMGRRRTYSIPGKNAALVPALAVKVVACAPVKQWARVRSPVGTSFLGEVFSRFFLTCKTNVGKL